MGRCYNGPMDQTPRFLISLERAFSRRQRALYLVGGTVRDHLLGRPVHDIDLTTDAPPTEVKALLRAAGSNAMYDVGERFGTIGAMFGDEQVEITTYRSESYTPGSRKPEVQFGTSLEADLARRDFTINAMATAPGQTEIIDPFGGRADLDSRLVRAVGNPDERFAEDPLRMLRAVRIAAELHFQIADETLDSIGRSAQALTSISQERISQELNRILLSKPPSLPIRQLCDLGLMQFIMPEFLSLRQYAPGQARHKDNLDHTLRVVDRTPPILTVRWGAMLHDIAKPRVMSVVSDEVHFYGHEMAGARMARKSLGRLKYDRATIERVSRIVELSGRINSYEGEWTDGAVRRLAREAGDAFGDLLLLSRADVTSRREDRVRAAEQRVDALQSRYDALQTEEDIERIRPPIDGTDLMEMFGRGPGPWIRPIKDHLLNLVIEGELAPDDRERAAEIARSLMENAPA